MLMQFQTHGIHSMHASCIINIITIWLFFHIFHGVLKARILKWLPFPSPVDQVLSEHIGKDAYAEKDWVYEEKDDRGWDGWMAYQLNGHEFEQTPGDTEGQGSLVCCSPWDHEESGMTERLNTTIWLNLHKLAFYRPQIVL